MRGQLAGDHRDPGESPALVDAGTISMNAGSASADA